MTIAVLEPLDNPDEPVLFGPPGTQAPTAAMPRAAKLVIPLVFGMTFGTVASISPAEALALQQHVMQPTTGAATGSSNSQLRLPGLLADYVASLRRRSGLTWGEFATALGVSRRAVHLWASGRRVSPRHVERLTTFASVLPAYEAATPELTRERLTVPENGGSSPLATLSAKHKPIRRTPMSGVSLSEALQADGTATAPIRTADRRSSLKAPKIGRGGSGSS